MTEYLQSFMPILSSELGHLGDELNGYVHILMLLLLVGWGIFFIYCLFRFSKKIILTLVIMELQIIIQAMLKLELLCLKRFF